MWNNFHVQIFSSFHTIVGEILNSNSNRLITYVRRDFKLTFDLSLKWKQAWNKSGRIWILEHLLYSKFFECYLKILRKIQIWIQSNFFFLSFSLPSLLSLPSPVSRPAGQSRRPRAAHPARSPPTWFAQTGHPNPLDLATRRHPVRARRGPPPKRHGDAVTVRPTVPRLASCPWPPRPLQQA